MKIKYMCEKCGVEFDTEEEAKKCEGCHGDIVDVSLKGSIPYNRGCEFPRSILVTVKNANGRVLKCEYQYADNYSIISEGDK